MNAHISKATTIEISNLSRNGLRSLPNGILLRYEVNRKPHSKYGGDDLRFFSTQQDTIQNNRHVVTALLTMTIMLILRRTWNQLNNTRCANTHPCVNQRQLDSTHRGHWQDAVRTGSALSCLEPPRTWRSLRPGNCVGFRPDTWRRSSTPEHMPHDQRENYHQKKCCCITAAAVPHPTQRHWTNSPTALKKNYAETNNNNMTISVTRLLRNSFCHTYMYAS